MHHCCHGAEHHAAPGHAGAQEGHHVLHVPLAEARFPVGGERWGIPVLDGDESAGERLVLGRRAQHIAGRVAGVAVPQALYQVRATVPLRRLLGIGLVFALVEVQCAPAGQQFALAVGEAQLMGPIALAHRCQRFQIGKDGVRIGARHPGIAGEGKRRVEQRFILGLPRVHGAVEVRRGPFADAGLRVGRDVRRINRAERCRHGQATGELLPAAGRVAGDAVPGAGKVFTARQIERLAGLRLCDAHAGVAIIQGKATCQCCQRQTAEKVILNACHGVSLLGLAAAVEWQLLGLRGCGLGRL